MYRALIHVVLAASSLLAGSWVHIAFALCYAALCIAELLEWISKST
jgi:hypothetical protein